MKPCSQAVANELLDLAKADNKTLSILPLIKLVYLVHAFSLAFYNKSALNPNFDTVEAWKYGPVIPCLYHELKHYGDQEITNKAQITSFENNSFDTKDAILEDSDIKIMCLFVWNSFKDYKPMDLVNFTHVNGSPWHNAYYKKGRNNTITDDSTKEYFKTLLNILKNDK